MNAPIVEPDSELRTGPAEFGGRTLQPGRTYRIRMEDCCVEGHFTGEFLGIRYVPNNSRHAPTVFDYPSAAVFSTGEIGPDWARDEDSCRILSQSARNGRRPVAGGRPVVR